MTREQERRWQELASARNNNGCALCAGWDKEMTVDGCAVQRDGMSAAFIEGAIVIFERGIAIGQIKVTHCPNCGAVNDVWIKGETPPPNHAEQRNEPSTGEIVRELRKMQNAAQVVLDSGFGTREGENNMLYIKRKAMAKNAADRLEQQERENAELKSRAEQAELARDILCGTIRDMEEPKTAGSSTFTIERRRLPQEGEGNK